MLSARLTFAASTLADAPPFSLSSQDLQHQADAGSQGVNNQAVILVDDEHWTFHADNTIERKRHVIYKILASSAVQSWGALQDRWEPWHEQRPSFRARVVTVDGAAHELDPKTVIDGPAGTNEPLAYSDTRIVQGPLPAIEVGSVVEFEESEAFTPLLGGLSFRGMVQEAVPVRFSRLIADYPASIPFRYSVALCPDLKTTSESRDAITHLTLTFGAFDAFKSVEPLLPFDTPRAPSITMSSGSSWNDLAKQYNDIVEKQIANAPVKPLVVAAQKGTANRDAIIAALVRTLHAQVRYTGVEFGDAAIVPATPADTLARKYGDCKDKASLLVAMLRAAGIPAYVALLNAGLEQDVSPNLPGMGMFNHAIVYVPGSPARWIDATTDHMNAAALPSADEGRLALIIRPETTALATIPESPSTANTESEVREYLLPDFGPAHLVDSVSGSGEIDAGMRQIFAMLDNGEYLDAFKKNAAAQWETKTPVGITYSKLDDFAQPFHVSFDVRDSKSVQVSVEGATLNLDGSSVLNSVPKPFWAQEDKDADNKDKKPRTAAYLFPTSFKSNLLMKVHLPTGFAVKELPADQTLKMGPATYTAHYAQQADLVTAELSFDSVKRTYTLEEGAALRKALQDFSRQPSPMLRVEPRGLTLLQAGHLREGLDAYRSMVPNPSASAVNHIRLSRALLSVGCGQQAREEAQIAVKMSPDLALAWSNVGAVNREDLIGRPFKRGWDPSVSEAAMRKAMALDKDDVSLVVQLAEILEHDAAGDITRETVARSVDVLLSLSDEKLEQARAQDTLLWQLAYLNRLNDLKLKLGRFGSNGSRAVYHAYLTAATEGGAKAVSELQSSLSGDDLKRTLQSLGGLLLLTAKYKDAADVAATALDPQQMPTADLLRSAKPIDPANLKTNTPNGTVLSFLAAQYNSGETAETLSRFWDASLPAPGLHVLLQPLLEGATRAITQGSWTASSFKDVILSSAKLNTESDADVAVRVRTSLAGSPVSLILIPQNGEWKLLGNFVLPVGVGRLALQQADKGNLEAARKLLDWMREDIKLKSEDDPLQGVVFPHLWNKGVAAPAPQVRYAAAALMTEDSASLPVLKEAMDATSDATLKTYYTLAYVYSCEAHETWSDCIRPAQSLVSSYPASDTAHHVLARAFSGAKKFDEAEKTLREDIAANPDDLGPKRNLINALAAGGRLKDALQLAKQVADSPGSTGFDWNLYGWISIFAGQTDAEKVHAVEHAQTGYNDAVQQTIASMYAETGDLNQALQISLRSLYQFGLQAPDSSWWYVFGRIAEQLNVPQSAMADYAMVKPDIDSDDPLSNYALAQRRLAALKR